MSSTRIHLYWAWNRPSMFQGVTKGYTVCGLNAEREDMTVHPEDATCKACRTLAGSNRQERPKLNV